MSEIQISKHARKRIAERVKIPKRAVDNHVAKSIQEGKTVADYEGGVKNYLKDRYRIRNGVDLIVVFQDYIYVWANGVLVTVLSLPDWVKDEIKNSNG